jgi:hypothetical protein
MRFRIFAAGLAMVALSVIATGPMLLSGCTRTVEREAEKRITLRGDAFVVTARPDNLRVVSVPVSLEGRLVPRDISRLDFDPDRAKLTILPVPELVLDYIARRLNPAIDLTHLPIRLQFTRSEVRGGYLILSGTVPPDDLVRASGQPLARPE